jgi:hypothetical protein
MKQIELNIVDAKKALGRANAALRNLDTEPISDIDRARTSLAIRAHVETACFFLGRANKKLHALIHA